VQNLPPTTTSSPLNSVIPKQMPCNPRNGLTGSSVAGAVHSDVPVTMSWPPVITGYSVTFATPDWMTETS